MPMHEMQLGVDVYKSRRRCGVMLCRWCRVNDDALLRVPHLEAVQMKTHQAPVLPAEQAHWLIGRDGGAAAIAYVVEARTALPQLNRVLPREVTASDPIFAAGFCFEIVIA